MIGSDEYHKLVEKLRAEGDALPTVNQQTGEIWCGRPPTGWKCTREPGHDGPCAATQVVNTKPVHVPCKSYTDSLPFGNIYREQFDAARAWMDRHDQEKHVEPGKHIRYAGAIGGAYTWHFTTTSLGQVIQLHCACGEAIDLTDYDNW